VDHDDARRILEVMPLGERGDRQPGLVVVRLGERERDALAPDRDIRGQRLGAVALERPAVAAREQRDGVSAAVVP
jgi:hypothetical protein